MLSRWTRAAPAAAARCPLGTHGALRVRRVVVPSAGGASGQGDIEGPCPPRAFPSSFGRRWRSSVTGSSKSAPPPTPPTWTHTDKTRSLLLDPDNPITNPERYRLHKVPAATRDRDGAFEELSEKERGWESSPYRACIGEDERLNMCRKGLFCERGTAPAGQWLDDCSCSHIPYPLTASDHPCTFTHICCLHLPPSLSPQPPISVLALPIFHHPPPFPPTVLPFRNLSHASSRTKTVRMLTSPLRRCRWSNKVMPRGEQAGGWDGWRGGPCSFRRAVLKESSTRRGRDVTSPSSVTETHL